MAHASKITVDSTTYDIKGKSVELNTTAPTSSFPSGLKFVYTYEEPETKYDGYMYIYNQSFYSRGLFSNGVWIKSWSDLVSEGYLSVSGTTVCSTALTSGYMNGELYGDNNILNIYNYAFYECSSLKSVYFLNCSSINVGAFYNCTSLTSANFPNCSYIGMDTFFGCSSLTTTNLSNCSFIGVEAFKDCISLTSINLPNCSYCGDFAFNNCTSLTSVSLPVCSYIYIEAFAYCSSLISIYLMSTSACALESSDAFSNTGITSSTGSIIVPTSLVTTYQSASNWSYFSNRIFGA